MRPWIITAVFAASVAGGAWAATPPPSKPAGLPRSPSFFPIAVWDQRANQTGHSAGYPDIAAAAAATGINVFLAQGPNWPEHFGSDAGEFETIHQHGLYVVGGTTVPSSENTSAQSVASIQALAHAIGADANLIGYNLGDEPQCVPGSHTIGMAQVPDKVSRVAAFDPTRLVLINQTDWMIQPQFQTSPPNCLDFDQSALQATSVASFDYYPLTNPYIATQLGVTGSDYQSVSNDSLWVQGLSVQATRHFALPGQPLWAFVEAGGDNFGFSGAANVINAIVTSNSNVLVNSSGRSVFTKTWVGLSVSGYGIPPGTTIASVVDPTHALMSAASTQTNGPQPVTVTGGANADCVASVNLCVVNGNEYRPTPGEVAAEVWMSIINGATGIEYFCQDTVSYSFCLGDKAAGGEAAALARSNLARIDQQVRLYAPVLNAPTAGICSMQLFDFQTGQASTAGSCSNGILTMATSNPAVPGMALAKRAQGGVYLFAQSDRRSQAGARFTFTLTGLGNRTATVIYNSNDRDPAGRQFALNRSGQFSDMLGGNHADYQMKVYEIR